jgi:hypothetical protein
MFSWSKREEPDAALYEFTARASPVPRAGLVNYDAIIRLNGGSQIGIFPSPGLSMKECFGEHPRAVRFAKKS